MSETEILTWKTPELKQHFTDWPASQHLNECWYVVRESIEVDADNYPYREYLRRDGVWLCGLDPDEVLGKQPNGRATYFKTIEEVINVLCEFEINVIGPDEED